MQVTPELIDSVGKAIVGVIAAVGAIVATITSAVAAFYTWKNRYELDKLYASTYRANPDGTPGPMRQHPELMVKLFSTKARNGDESGDQVLVPTEVHTAVSTEAAITTPPPDVHHGD